MNKFIRVTDNSGNIWVSVDRILYIEEGINNEGAHIKVGENLISVKESVGTIMALMERIMEDWHEDRIDIIGRNGNDGIHYDIKDRKS
jgi:hypothetical protein